MVPDIKIKDFYLRYVYNAKKDIENYTNTLSSIEETINELHQNIEENIDVVNDRFGINLSKFEIEWINKEYNNTEYLYKQVIKLVKVLEDDNRAILIQLLKYCYKLKEKSNTKRLILIAEKRKDLSFKKYKELVSKYYMGVHKAVLEGFGYKYGAGIGTFIINYYKMDNPTKKTIDFAETNRRKRELIAKGLKAYDDKDAAWFKERGLPYDGVEYRVYLDRKFYYDFTFLESKVFKKKELDYQRTEYVHLKLRGMSYQEMGDKLCNNIDDIVNLNVDLKYKLNILLYKYPEKYLNFVRNADQSKYKY